MHPSEFKDIYLKDLLENLSHENKTIVMMGDFNIDLLKYDTEKDSADFLDSTYASFLLPYISAPSHVTPRSKRLIDNIFSNNIEDGSISGNIVTTISDHYAQFLLLQNLNNKNPIKNEIYHQDFKKLNKNNLERDLVNTNWDAILEVHNGDVDKSFGSFITTVNSIITEHAPFKKISVKERQLRAKPWITKKILISTTKTKHTESIAEQKTKLEEMSCTTYLKNIKIQLIR